jgi:hypothetical protein
MTIDVLQITRGLVFPPLRVVLLAAAQLDVQNPLEGDCAQLGHKEEAPGPRPDTRQPGKYTHRFCRCEAVRIARPLIGCGPAWRPTP